MRPLHRHVKCTAFVPMTLKQVTLCQSLENSDCTIRPWHAKVMSQMGLNCNIANVPTQATNLNLLEQAIILRFVLKHLGYCYRSLGESYSWETDSWAVFSSCFYYCISVHPLIEFRFLPTKSFIRLLRNTLLIVYPWRKHENGVRRTIHRGLQSIRGVSLPILTLR